MPTLNELFPLHQKQPEPSPAPEDEPIGFYANAEAKKQQQTCTLAELHEAVLSDLVKEKVEKIRAAFVAGDTKKAGDMKRELPAVSLSGKVGNKELRKGAAEEGRFTHSGFLQIDIDAKDHPGMTLDAMRAKLVADPHIQAVFVSPSGSGVKAVARIPADIATHKAAFLTAEKHFAALGLTIDKSCKDPVRLCFVSHDPEAWLRPTDATEFVVEAEPELDTTSTGIPTDPDDDEEESFVSNHIFSAKGGLIIRGGNFLERDEPTLDDLAAMLKGISRPPYSEWLEIISGAWNHFGEAATPVLAAQWPEEKPGEYARKFKQRTKDHTLGTVWHFAELNGWKPTKRLREIKKEEQAQVKISALLAPKEDGSTAQKFIPEHVFYDGPAGRYLVKIGKSFFTYGRKGPVVTGLTRHFAPKHQKATAAALAAVVALADRELDGGVQWAGNIAGHPQGITTDTNGLPILITAQADAPTATQGDAELITSIIADAFADTTALQVFMSWISTRYRAVIEHTHIPAPMLVLAGEVNSGKSLLAWIVSQLLGGRTANPYAAWTGGILWNDDLVGAELLLVDDCIGSTDIRSRRNFGASFKEAIYPHVIQLRKRNTSSLAVRPVWCVMVCCNDTPEALQIIPPLDTDLSDKVALLHVEKISLPIDTSTPAGKTKLQRLIRAELPAFADQLLKWETPQHLKDSRSGVIAWRDPELSEAVDAHSPAKRLEGLLESALTHRGIWHDIPRDLTASEIEARMLDHQSPVRDQAKTLFSWHGACGSALAKLARTGSRFVTISDKPALHKVLRYSITPNYEYTE